jgi:hypothetical protein
VSGFDNVATVVIGPGEAAQCRQTDCYVHHIDEVLWERLCTALSYLLTSFWAPRTGLPQRDQFFKRPLPLTPPSSSSQHFCGQRFCEVGRMAKTLEDFRAQNLRLLEQISSDDPDYIDKWMQQFDRQHGIKLRPASMSQRRRDAASSKKAMSQGRSS